MSTIKEIENKPNYISQKAGETQKDTHQEQSQNKNLEKNLSVRTPIKNNYVRKEVRIKTNSDPELAIASQSSMITGVQEKVITH